jgi:hypothetical protein
MNLSICPPVSEIPADIRVKILYLEIDAPSHSKEWQVLLRFFLQIINKNLH